MSAATGARCQEPGGRPDKSDGLVLDTILAGQQRSESGIWLVQQGKKNTPADRYRLLLEWVLPNQEHAHFRVTADYLASPTGPQIVSPAIELIQLAIESGKSAELREQISRSLIASPSDLADQAAMLALLAIAQPDLEQAVPLLDHFYVTLLADKRLLVEARDAALLCTEQASRLPQLSELAYEPAQAIIQFYVKEATRKPWHRHFWAAHAKIRKQVLLQQTGGPSFVDRLTQWHPVSRSSAF